VRSGVSRSEAEQVFVKLGGAVITDKSQAETPRPRVIARLADEVRAALETRPDLHLVLGHGSGSFGHVAAAEYGTREGVQSAAAWRGFARVADIAARLNRLVAAAFLDAGVPIWSLQPSASARCRDGRLVRLDVGPIAMALGQGLVPLVYGDVALDEVRGGTIISTEQIFLYLAGELQPNRIVLVSEVDGVYDADPLKNTTAQRFDVITAENWDRVRSALGGALTTDVTGGMLTKVESLVQWLRSDTPAADDRGRRARLVSGLRAGALQSALLDTDDAAGTLIQW
jgi:isopentenyl phosphate kinase